MQQMKNNAFHLQDLISLGYRLAGELVRKSANRFYFAPVDGLKKSGLLDEPACYLWIAEGGAVLYVGETKRGVRSRMLSHTGCLNNVSESKTGTSIWVENMHKILVDFNADQFHVYYARFPFLHNFLSRPEFVLSSLGSKSKRLLEETSVIHYFQPLINRE